MGLRIIVKNADYSANGISYYAPDLERYFNTLGIKDTVQPNDIAAIVKVYNSLKEGVDPLWNYLDAFYPLIGNMGGIKENLIHATNYKMTRDDTVPPIIDSVGVAISTDNTQWNTHRFMGKPANYEGAPDGGTGSLNYWYYKTNADHVMPTNTYFSEFNRIGRGLNKMHQIEATGNGTNVFTYSIPFSKGLVMYQSNFKETGFDEEHLIIDGLKKASKDITGNYSMVNNQGVTNYEPALLGGINYLANDASTWSARFGCAGFGKSLSDLQIKKLNNIIQKYLFDIGRITESDKNTRIITI